MNQFKCRHCDLSAHFYFREGGMLCVDHAEAFCLAQAQDMMQRSRLDNSTSFSSANSFSGIGSARGTSAMLHPEVVDGSTALTLQVGTAVTAGRDRQPNFGEIDGQQGQTKKSSSISRERADTPKALQGEPAAVIGGCEDRSGLSAMSRKSSSLPAISPPRSEREIVCCKSGGGDEDVSRGDNRRNREMRSSLRELSREAPLGRAPAIGETAPNSACASLEAPPGTSSAALSGSSGTPAQERPLTSFNRSSTTTFRVAASSLIHESSDIPNHHQ